jgi:hypothetical protein
MFSYGLAPGTGTATATDGASAYEIAVANGFTGTVQQWLLSLTGSQGPAGVTGPIGLTGSTGPQGPQGVAGVAGPQGAVGPAGPVGTQGERGIQGVTGATGAAGPTGLTGLTGPAGPQGERGLTGATGVQGPQGVQGSRGERGETGQRGDHFATSSVTPLAISSSGSVSLTVEPGLAYTVAQYVLIARSASVFMRGHVSSYDDVTGVLVVDLDFSSGSGSYDSWTVNIDAVGSVGASAYEVAVANGFAGPESAWLESLVGEQGPAGLSGIGAYHHVQAMASTVWQVSHNLGFNPSVTIHDEDENVIIGAIDYVDENTLNLLFNAAIAGNAHLS